MIQLKLTGTPLGLMVLRSSDFSSTMLCVTLSTESRDRKPASSGLAGEKDSECPAPVSIKTVMSTMTVPIGVSSGEGTKILDSSAQVWLVTLWETPETYSISQLITIY